MAGGVVAAICGPELAKWSAGLLEPLTFAGCFAAIAVLNVAVLLLLQATRIPAPTAIERRETGRPIRSIARQPTFLVAALGGMVGYSVMALVMTATPLAMVACGFGFPDAAFVIQWHGLGMSAPSFVTGRLIARFGALSIMAIGAALMLVCIGVNLSGVAMLQFWSGLVLLGVGWNFLFIGATTLLTEVYAPAERAKTQALNDFMVFTAVAAASFFSGAIHNRLGWDGVNFAAIAPVVAALGAILWLRMRRAALAPSVQAAGTAS
jgi:predicted MFS family arabinose efflux permease